MGGRFYRRSGCLLAVFAGLLAALAVGSPASAHNSFTGSNPKNGAKLAEAPKEVRLTFLAALTPKATKVTITGPDGADAAQGSPQFAGKRVSVPLKAGPAGVYTVAYEVASGDGHPVKGKVKFTLTTGAAPATTAATPSPSALPSSAVAATAPSLDPATLAKPDEDGGPPWWVWAVGGLVLVGAVGAGTQLLARRRP